MKLCELLIVVDQNFQGFISMKTGGIDVVGMDASQPKYLHGCHVVLEITKNSLHIHLQYSVCSPILNDNYLRKKMICLSS